MNGQISRGHKERTKIPSKWKNVISVTFAMTWLLVADRLIWVFHKLWFSWEFAASDSHSRIFCYCSPSTSRFNMCIWRHFSSHHGCKDWLEWPLSSRPYRPFCVSSIYCFAWQSQNISSFWNAQTCLPGVNNQVIVIIFFLILVFDVDTNWSSWPIYWIAA